MRSASRGYAKLIAAVMLVSLAGCSKSEPAAEKRTLTSGTWFDYGNGLINLNQVKNITSQSNVIFYVTSKDYVDNQNRWQEYRDALDDEHRAIVDAHLDFCYDTLHSDAAYENDRQGRYEWGTLSRGSSLGDYVSGSGKSELRNSIESYKKFITAEFAKACVVVVKGDASITFDGFRVSLPSLEKVFSMTVDEKAPPSESAVHAEFDTAIGGLREGLTPWESTYANLIKG
jgi:hypothetical protein